MNTYPLENRNGGNAGRRGRRPTNGFSALTGGADCFQDGRDGVQWRWSVDGWMVGENDRRAWIEGGREEVCNSAPACRMLIFSFFCLTRIDPMMKREALSRGRCGFKVGMLQLTTGHEENRDRQRQ